MLYSWSIAEFSYYEASSLLLLQFPDGGDSKRPSLCCVAMDHTHALTKLEMQGDGGGGGEWAVSDARDSSQHRQQIVVTSDGWWVLFKSLRLGLLRAVHEPYKP